MVSFVHIALITIVELFCVFYTALTCAWSAKNRNYWRYKKKN